MDHVQKSYANANIIYINKEDLAFSSIRNAGDLNDYVTQRLVSGQFNAVFIDEIQDIADFHVALRSLLLKPDIDLYITGSNAHLLSSDLAGYLSGRFVEMNVYSLAYPEFLEFHQLEDEEASLDAYMKYGGLPYLKHVPLNDEVVLEYLKNIYSTIIYRDVVNRFGVRNTAFLERLVQFLASHIGSIFSAKKISDFLKSQNVRIQPAQVQNYIGHLRSAFLVFQVPRYDIQGKRVFEFGEKLYFENVGIRNAITGYRPQDLNKIVENTVYHHLKYCGYEIKTGERDGEEIDFVAEKSGETRYYQVALRLTEEKTIRREFGNLDKVRDHYPKTVITLDSFEGNTFKGIDHQSLRTFLQTCRP